MPRPKVKPEERQRAVKACRTCHSAKTKCDGQAPCATCVKRGKESLCTYDTSPAPEKKRRTTVNDNVVVAINGPDVTFSNNSDLSNYDPRVVSLSSNGIAPGSHHAATLQQPPWLQSRVLSSSTGERLYVGPTTSFSFLQFLRDTLRQQMGPSPFTERDASDKMLEIDHNEIPPSAIDPEDERDLRRKLTACYFQATSGLIDVYDSVDASDLLSVEKGRQVDQPAFDQRQLNDKGIGLNLMVAIGGQSCGANDDEVSFAAQCFKNAQAMAFEGMLCNPSLNMARHFALMAFYMLGACHRNAAFIYLGVASKTAGALGLHVDDVYRSLDQVDRDIRIRTFRSLFTLDVLITSLLGRAWGSSREANFSVGCRHFPDTINLSDRQLAINATYHLCGRIDRFQQEFTAQKPIDILSAETYIQDLKALTDTLPPHLCNLNGLLLDHTCPEDYERVTAAVHVTCVYYFAIILGTRPFFIAHCVSRLVVQQGTGNGGPHNVTVADTAGTAGTTTGTSTTASQSKDPQTSERVMKLVNACFDSAMFIARTAHNALAAGFLLGNMCVLKAYLFTSGLLLGFAKFVRKSPLVEVTHAFKDAIEVLEVLGKMSPQARLYFDILRKFSNAIDAYRLMGTAGRKENGEGLVKMMFGVGSPTGGIGGGTGPGMSPNVRRDSRLAAGSDFDARMDRGPEVAVEHEYDIGGAGSANGQSITQHYPDPIGPETVDELPSLPAEDLNLNWQPFSMFVDDFWLGENGAGTPQQGALG